jgi:hypothetical protein
MEFLLAWAISCTVTYHGLNEAVCNKWTEKAKNGATIYKVQIVNTIKTDIRTVGRCTYLGAKTGRTFIQQLEGKWCKHEP